MKNHLTKTRSFNYLRNRDKITTGSCILWKGKGIVSWLIRRFSKFSHASFVIRLDRLGPRFIDRIFLVEALAEGPTLRLLSSRIADFKGEVYLFIPDNVETTSCLLDQALTICAEGLPYDYQSLFTNILGRVNSDARKFFCSELVDFIWQKCHIPRRQNLKVPPNKAPRPGDIPNWYNGELIKIS